MHFYKLLHAFNKDIGTIYCNEFNINGLDEFIITKGTMIETSNKMKLYYNDNNIAEDYLDNSLIWPICSYKMISVFNEYNKGEIQAIPVEIINKQTNEQLCNYYALNILNTIDGSLDLNLTKHRRDIVDNSVILGVFDPVLRYNHIEASDIFRIKEYEESIFISERIRHAFKKNKITGCDYKKVRTV